MLITCFHQFILQKATEMCSNCAQLQIIPVPGGYGWAWR
jgi:hypothetical protein